MKRHARFHFNDLAEAETERLAIASEEMGESIQIIGKILRHGFDSKSPVGSDNNPTNRELLTKELGNVLASIELLVKGGDIDQQSLNQAKVDKLNRLKQWVHHQLGTL